MSQPIPHRSERAPVFKEPTFLMCSPKLYDVNYVINPWMAGIGLFALRWKCFNRAEAKMQVFETAYKGEVRPWGKTKKSLGMIHLPKALVDALWQWKQQGPDDSPDSFIFPDANGGFMDTGNYRKRVMAKVAADLGLPKLTFQVIRRSIATLAQRKGTVKDVQGLLRHSRTATTTDVYMQELPEGVAATVDAISRELRKKPKKSKRQKLSENLLSTPAVWKMLAGLISKDILVDLVGIEPTTSSMPWNSNSSRPLILNGLNTG
jgi:hypothetical protein